MAQQTKREWFTLQLKSGLLLDLDDDALKEAGVSAVAAFTREQAEHVRAYANEEWATEWKDMAIVPLQESPDDE